MLELTTSSRSKELARMSQPSSVTLKSKKLTRTEVPSSSNSSTLDSL
jgi:hypothetical protein